MNTATAFDHRTLTGWVLADVDGADLSAILRRHWPQLAQVVPEIGALDMDQGDRHLHKDNVAHTIAVTAKVPPTLVLRLAALFHDVGKPPTRVVHPDATVTFHQHEIVGAHITRRVLHGLGYDAGTVEQVTTIVELSGATKDSAGWSDAAVRRFVVRAGDVLDDLLEFAALDVTSRHAHKHVEAREQVVRLRARIDAVAAIDAERARRPVVDGNAIMSRYGLGPGPRVGELVRVLLDTQRDHPELGPDEAWALLDPLVMA